MIFLIWFLCGFIGSVLFLIAQMIERKKITLSDIVWFIIFMPFGMITLAATILMFFCFLIGKISSLDNIILWIKKEE